MVSAEERRAHAQQKLLNTEAPKSRTQSLATRADTDMQKLVEDAKKFCKYPVKLSWQNVKFEVEVKYSKEESEMSGGA